MNTDAIVSYLYIHAHTLLASLGRLMRVPFSLIMTVVVIAIALALPTGFYIIINNVQQITSGLVSNNQISLFLQHDLPANKSEDLLTHIQEQVGVSTAKLVSKQDALEEFRTFSGFGEALDALNFNPLPAVILIEPDDHMHQPAALEAFLVNLQQMPGVDFAQLDMQWVNRLHATMQIAERGVWMLSLLLAIAVVFIIGNTIRLELQNRREEIVVQKLIGATDSFIRRPFLYSGFWYGLLASLLAWGLVMILLLLIQQPVETLTSLYESQYRLLFLSFSDTLYLIILASLLGILGAWSVLGYHLRLLNPE